MKTISIVTPCYNEEASISECIDAVRSVFRERLASYSLEHIFCDNASTDRTVEILKSYAEKDPSVKIIVNSRNFGILKNNFNGVLNTSGDAVVLFLPADLQDPPDLIPDFVKFWEQGYEVVYGLRAKREEGLILRLTRKLYYRILSRLAYVEYPPDAGDFQLVDRRVVDVLKRFSDVQPFMRMMTFDAGFRSIGVKYSWRARKHGKSHNRLPEMLRQGIGGIVSYSGAPVRLALLFGLLIAAMSLFFAVCVMVLVLIGHIETPRGVPTIIVALFFFGGVQLFFIGIVGEYILAIYNQVRRRPLVIERERYNFDKVITK